MPRLTATSWGCLAASIMSLVALAHMPYAYYILLRWAVFAASIAAGVILVQRNRPAWALAGWGLALLFNPLVRIPLRRDTWEVVNVVAAVLLVVLAFAVSQKKKPNERI